MKYPPFNVTLSSAGSSKDASINKLYLTQGPICVYEKLGEDGFPMSLGRLDELAELTIEDDLSTRKVTTTGDSQTTAKTGNAVKRAVVGGVLLGGTGAVIGGVTGTKDTKISTQSVEEINYLVNARLRFKNGKTLLLQIKQPEVLTFISSFIGAEPMPDEELAKHKEVALVEQEKIRQRHAQYEKENQARRWAISQVPANRFSENEAATVAFLLAIAGAGVYVYASNDDSIWWWGFRIVFWGIIFAIPLIAVLSIVAKSVKTEFDKKVEALTQQRLASIKDE